MINRSLSELKIRAPSDGLQLAVNNANIFISPYTYTPTQRRKILLLTAFTEQYSDNKKQKTPICYV